MSLETFVRTKSYAKLPDGLPEELMKRQAGAFVSIHLDGELRGCIGTIAAVQDDLSQEIMHNAISACSQDPRFMPVTDEELPFQNPNQKQL